MLSSLFLISVGFMLLQFHINCSDQQVCTYVQSRDCRVCYEGQQFRSCHQQYCKRARRSLFGFQRCREYAEEDLNLDECSSRCCPSAEGGIVALLKTDGNISQCVGDETEEGRTVTSLIIGSLIGLALFILVICCFCYCRWMRSLGSSSTRNEYSGTRNNNSAVDHLESIRVRLLRQMNLLNQSGLSRVALVKELKWQEKRSHHRKMRKQEISSEQCLGEKEEEGQVHCVICLMESPDCITKCRHEFHLQCFAEWIKKNAVCPVCVGHEFNPIVLLCQSCKCMETQLSIDKYTSVVTKDGRLQINRLRAVCENCLHQHPAEKTTATLK